MGLVQVALVLIRATAEVDLVVSSPSVVIVGYFDIIWVAAEAGDLEEDPGKVGMEDDLVCDNWKAWCWLRARLDVRLKEFSGDLRISMNGQIV